MKTKKTKLDRQVTRLAEKALKESAVLADQIDASITETQSRDKTKKQPTLQSAVHTILSPARALFPVELQDQALELLQAEHDKRLAEKYASGPTVSFDLSGLAPDALVKAEAALRLVNEANALEQLKVAYNNIPDQGTWSFFPHTRLSLQRLHAVRHAGNTLLKIHPEAARYCELKALNILVTLRRDLARYMKVVRDQIGQLEGSSATWALAGGDAADSAVIANVPMTSTSSPTKTKTRRTK